MIAGTVIGPAGHLEAGLCDLHRIEIRGEGRFPGGRRPFAPRVFYICTCCFTGVRVKSYNGTKQNADLQENSLKENAELQEDGLKENAELQENGLKENAELQ